jgi:hypothetical protein
LKNKACYVVYVRVISPLRSYTETKGKRQKMVFNPLEPKVSSLDICFRPKNLTDRSSTFRPAAVEIPSSQMAPNVLWDRLCVKP